MSKSNKKRKATKKDLKNMVSGKPLERVMKDMEIVNGLMDKINDFRFGDELNEEEADKSLYATFFPNLFKDYWPREYINNYK